MPVYEYRCDTCNATFTRAFRPDAAAKSLLDAGLVGCSDTCLGHLRRRFSFTVPVPFQAHFNESQGAWVESYRELEDNAKRASEAASIRTGVEHRFRPIPVHEARPDDDAGLAATHDRQVALGKKEPTPYRR